MNDKCKKQPDIDITEVGAGRKCSGLDLISRRAAIDAIYEHEFSNWCDKDEVSTILFDLPSAEKTGKWLSQVGGGYRCSECGRDALHDVGEKFALLFTKSKYCPHCGAKMEDE